ncbi:hypothetical protein H2204_011444 [Knufia peltigerae]|uniref:Cytochrome P450 n=1 Tax=Knufia peltigerae TaxID=1002370 RepID=A0AA38XU71_9EURO|nr:hypothetical protein H2204_011444 [Knufia peltigerae]
MLGYFFSVVTAAAAFGYLVLVPLINYFRDPKGLRKYPTLSILSGISDLPFIYEAHKGFRSQTLLNAHKKHPVIRIGPNSLSFSKKEAIKDIYGHNTKCIKDTMYDVLAGTHYHLADVVDRPEHARKRKMLSSAYAIKNLEGWEHKVADVTSRLIKSFDDRCTEPLAAGDLPSPEDQTVDYRMWTNLFTVCAIANIGLSEDLGFLERGDDLVTSEGPDGTLKQVHFRECLHATAWAQSNLVWSYKWFETLVRISKLVSPTYRRKWGLNKDWDGIVRNRATTRFKRFQAGEKLNDFFSALLFDKYGGPNDLEWGEMVAEVSIMMNAGSDTTAIAMNNVMYLLLKNPRCLQNLREEIDGTLDEDEVVAPYDKVKHLPYLRACLDESMRLFPPTTFGLPRKTPPEGAAVVEEYIPGNTTVSISSYVAHRDADVFPDSEMYNPDRWMGEEGKNLQPFFIAFSAGARGCIGRNISYLEQMVLLASLLHRYEFALPHPEWEPTRRENFNLSPGPMPLKVWRRKCIEEA